MYIFTSYYSEISDAVLVPDSLRVTYFISSGNFQGFYLISILKFQLPFLLMWFFHQFGGLFQS